MTKSALQIARAAYQPKLPKALKGTVKAAEGAATQSVANQEEIKKLFPNTYGMPLIKFETTDEAANFPAMNVGVILSGSEYAGLGGSKAGCEAHKGEFDDVPTIILSYDTIHDPKYLMTNYRDLNGTVKVDKAVSD